MSLSIGIGILTMIGLGWGWFHRHPDRTNFINCCSRALVSPADGRVIQVKPGHIAIFLAPWDVHVQYSPTKGYIGRQRYKRGSFHPAYLLQKSTYNERLETEIIPDEGSHSIWVIQIAGQLVRRIRSYVKPGDPVQQGQELGMIQLGSRVDIYYAVSDWPNIKIQVGDHVTGAVTILVTK